MKTNPRNGRAAFTLIELMAVITIIVILAGLVVGGMGFVNERQAKEKAKVQLKLIEKALEEYKLDKGKYPPTGNSASGEELSSILFRALYSDGANDTTQKIYLPELDPGTAQNPNKQGWTSLGDDKIRDPWGNEYRYRTAKNASGNTNNHVQNPDFDLWSVGKDGKTKAARNELPNAPENKDDIRNF